MATYAPVKGNDGVYRKAKPGDYSPGSNKPNNSGGGSNAPRSNLPANWDAMNPAEKANYLINKGGAGSAAYQEAENRSNAQKPVLTAEVIESINKPQSIGEQTIKTIKDSQGITRGYEDTAAKQSVQNEYIAKENIKAVEQARAAQRIQEEYKNDSSRSGSKYSISSNNGLASNSNISKKETYTGPPDSSATQNIEKQINALNEWEANYDKTMEPARKIWEQEANYLTFGGLKPYEQRGGLGKGAESLLLNFILLPDTTFKSVTVGAAKVGITAQALFNPETRGNVLPAINEAAAGVKKPIGELFTTPEGVAVLATLPLFSAVGRRYTLGALESERQVIGKKLKTGKTTPIEIQTTTYNAPGIVESVIGKKSINVYTEVSAEQIIRDNKNLRVQRNIQGEFIKTGENAPATEKYYFENKIYTNPRSDGFIPEVVIEKGIPARVSPEQTADTRGIPQGETAGGFDALNQVIKETPKQEEKVRLFKEDIAPKVYDEKGQRVKEFIINIDGLKNPAKTTKIIEEFMRRVGGEYFGSITTKQLPAEGGIVLKGEKITKGFQNKKVGDIDAIIDKTVEDIAPLVEDLANDLRLVGEDIGVSTSTGQKVTNVLEFKSGEFAGNKFLEAKSTINQPTLGLNDAAPKGIAGYKFADIKKGQTPQSVPFGENRAITAGEQTLRKFAGALMISSGEAAGETASFSKPGLLGKQGNPRGLKDTAGAVQGTAGIAEIQRKSLNPFRKAKGEKLAKAYDKFVETYEPEQQADLKDKLVDMIGAPEENLAKVDTKGLAENEFYHATASENVNAINTEGLKPQQWAGGKFTFITKDLKVATTSSGSKGMGKTKGLTFYKIKLTPKQLKEVQAQPDYTFEATVTSDIKPNQMEIVKKPVISESTERVSLSPSKNAADIIKENLPSETPAFPVSKINSPSSPSPAISQPKSYSISPLASPSSRPSSYLSPVSSPVKSPLPSPSPVNSPASSPGPSPSSPSTKSPGPKSPSPSPSPGSPFKSPSPSPVSPGPKSPSPSPSSPSPVKSPASPKSPSPVKSPMYPSKSPPPGISKLPQTKKQKKGKYTTFVRRRGVFQKLAESDTLQEATYKGVSNVQNTAAASFKISGPDSITRERSLIPQKTFYESKKESGVFIQKAFNRIATPGEKKEITSKGIFTNKIRRG